MTRRKTLLAYEILALGVAIVLWTGAIPAPASAQTLTVTTLTDTADPPFDGGDWWCGTGTVSDLPGADGKTSLREALSAANNTIANNVINAGNSAILTSSWRD